MVLNEKEQFANLLIVLSKQWIVNNIKRLFYIPIPFYKSPH